MKSLWESTVRIPKRRPAEGLYERDVVVIGAGMTGILTAWQLQKAGKRVAVLEGECRALLEEFFQGLRKI